MADKKKRVFMLRTAIEHNEGLPEEDLDLTLRKTEDLRIELQLDKLRVRMGAVRDVNGSDLKRKKIHLPYVPGASDDSVVGPKARLYHSQQNSPKARGPLSSQVDKTTKRATELDDELTAIGSSGFSPAKKRRGNNSSRLGELFNHTIVTGSPNNQHVPYTHKLRSVRMDLGR